MRFFIDLVYILLAVIFSTIIFTILFNVLNKSILKIFVPLQKIANGLKKKELFKRIIDVISIFLCVAIKYFLNLNYIGFGIVIGLFCSLNNVIFSEGIVIKKNKNGVI